MKTRAYTLLGFAAWQGIKLAVRRKLSQNRGTVAAVLTVALVVIGGFAAARSDSGEE